MILGTPGAELAALIEPVPSKLNGFDQLQKYPLYSSLEEFLASGINVDVINICTPNGLHAPLAIEANGTFKERLRGCDLHSTENVEAGICCKAEQVQSAKQMA
jgi:hypothetical protein